MFSLSNVLRTRLRTRAQILRKDSKKKQTTKYKSKIYAELNELEQKESNSYPAHQKVDNDRSYPYF